MFPGGRFVAALDRDGAPAGRFCILPRFKKVTRRGPAAEARRRPHLAAGVAGELKAVCGARWGEDRRRGARQA
jgi:hypothetical protein